MGENDQYLFMVHGCGCGCEDGMCGPKANYIYPILSYDIHKGGGINTQFLEKQTNV